MRRVAARHGWGRDSRICMADGEFERRGEEQGRY